MTTSASGASRNTSPPSTPEAEIVPTIRIRPEVKVKLMAGPPDGMKSDSIYIRRFWVAAIGPGAVADLLRTIRAGQQKRTVTYPIYLHVLVQSGLAAFDGARVTVPHPVPLLPAHLVRRLPPALRREHAIWLRLRKRAS
jgi:hypothetical protein